jgi:hypothetical protein
MAIRQSTALLRVLLGACSASAGSGSSSRSSESVPLAWAPESVRIAQEEAVWKQDSVVLDSLSRTVNTDSLFRVGRAMLISRDPARLMNAAACERYRLAWRHGARPAQLAIWRMEDTLYAADEADAVEQMRERLDRGFGVELGRKSCGDPGLRAPRTVGATPLDGILARTSVAGRP